MPQQANQSAVRGAAPSSFTLRPLSGAVALALAGLCALAPAQAQTAAPAVQQAAARQGYNIPAGPLAATLRNIASSAGVPLAFTADLTDGKTSAVLRGQFTTQEAFAAALAGSGLQSVLLSNGAYVLRKQAAAAPGASAAGVASQTMAAVTVTATATARTEGSDSYTTGVANTATKLNLALRDTPQSVSVLTRRQIDDLGIKTLDDAVQSITGLVTQKGNYAGDSGSFGARGFAIDNMLFDGVPTSLGTNASFNADNDDLAIYDRIEVVRGAAGLTTGAGTPSAAINMVRKRPTLAPQVLLSASAGSWNNYRGELDAAGPLNEAKTLRGRVVITAQDKKNFYDVVHDRQHQVYGILEAALAARTTLTLGLHYRKSDSDGLSIGVPTAPDGKFLALPRSIYLGNDFDYWRQTDKTAFAELEQRFDNDWRVRLALTHKTPEIATMMSGLSRKDGKLYQNSQSYKAENAQTSYDAYATGPFTLFGRQHELTLGLSHRKALKNSYGGWSKDAWTDQAQLVDPFHWNSGTVTAPDINYSQWGTKSSIKQSAVYGATRLRLADPLSLIVGARVSWYKDEKNFSVAREVTPYAGVVYDLDARHSVYASWTEVFQPQGINDKNKQPLKPISGSNYEAGVKGEYFDGALNASAAVFQIRQQNRAVDDLSGPSVCPGSNWGYCKRASGEVRSEGVELEASGALTPNWQLSGGYTYVSAKYTKDSDVANIGKVFDSKYPAHQLKLATSYRLPGAWQQWRVGASLYGQSAVYGAGDGARVDQGRYAVAGLNAGYQIDSKAELRVNVNNLFDKHYYQGVYSDVFGNLFGTPRSVMLTLNYKL
ncbi:TonB-dependent siderophore receptor [Janthinobacterium fluminis]|uniref:TonB-dependent siderophore receptor n=1 Tax=Janthinobacterium fluminis TaxID=2987524 RepID=A0ABT5K154_9BURK|nr:TonB-dependent receptor [Janthinobacterium fluminis]MDC8758707.1 TonB-dependent siderophore receptor [Janthinobacterium fluminis]